MMISSESDDNFSLLIDEFLMKNLVEQRGIYDSLTDRKFRKLWKLELYDSNIHHILSKFSNVLILGRCLEFDSTNQLYLCVSSTMTKLKLKR